VMVFIFLLAGILFYYSLILHEQTFALEAAGWKREITCMKLSDMVSKTYAGGDGTNWGGNVDINFAILKGGTIIFGDFNADVNALGGYGTYDANAVAYYNCNNNELNLYPFLYDANVHLYVNYGQDCGLGNDDEIDQLIADLNNYGMVFLEEPKLSNVYENSFDDWVYNGGLLILGGQVLKSNGTFITQEYYKIANQIDKNAVVVDTHILYPDLEPGGLINFLLFDEAPYFQDSNSLHVIARYVDNNYAAISNWYYGEGEVIHIADYNTATFDAGGQQTDTNFAYVAARPALHGGYYIGPVEFDYSAYSGVSECEFFTTLYGEGTKVWDIINIQNENGVIFVEQEN
jgi:hypothetical protein